MIRFLDLKSQYDKIRKDIDEAIASVIERTAFISGDDVRWFEEEFAAYQDAKHCIGVGNGTDAIEIAIECLRLPPGSEIIVPANSFIASSEAVTRSGHKVVFADVDEETYTLDVADVRRRLTPRTRAILAVHLYGHPARMDELLAVAEENNLRIVEDCAQAHGAEFKGRRVGAIGDVGAFSFYPGKNLGAYGDGGAITTNDSALAELCRMTANHGRKEKYLHEFEGRNSRLDGLQAAILRVKLKSLDEWLERRRAVAEIYWSELDGIDGLNIPGRAAHGRHALHLYVIRARERDALAAYLRCQGIETGVHYPIALPKQPAYLALGQADEAMFANRSDGMLLSLPIGEHLSGSEARQVAERVRQFFSR